MNTLLHLRRQGYRESTLVGFSRRLRHLASHADLDDPERVKEFVAAKNCSDGFKGNLINAYRHYAMFHRLDFLKPRYNRVDRIRKVPRTEDINKIIAHAKPKYALAYSILRDTGLRPIELTWLRLKEIDLEKVGFTLAQLNTVAQERLRLGRQPWLCSRNMFTVRVYHRRQGFGLHGNG